MLDCSYAQHRVSFFFGLARFLSTLQIFPSRYPDLTSNPHVRKDGLAQFGFKKSDKDQKTNKQLSFANAVEQKW